MWLEQNLPLLKAFDWLQFVKHDPSVADDEVDIDYLIDNLWLVGSPATVAAKIVDTHDVLGGFGTIVVNKYDYGETPEAYHRSLELLADDVMPNVERQLAKQVQR